MIAMRILLISTNLFKKRSFGFLSKILPVVSIHRPPSENRSSHFATCGDIHSFKSPNGAHAPFDFMEKRAELAHGDEKVRRQQDDEQRARKVDLPRAQLRCGHDDAERRAASS